MNRTTLPQKTARHGIPPGSSATSSPKRSKPNAIRVRCVEGSAIKRKLTIPVKEAVSEGLQRTIGRRRISQIIENLHAPQVVPLDIEAAYPARELEAIEWSEGLIADSSFTELRASR